MKREEGKEAKSPPPSSAENIKHKTKTKTFLLGQLGFN